ncbi:hypothetical protein ACET3Z_028357 [Daucus carota]
MATDRNLNDGLISPVPEKKLKIDTSLCECTLLKKIQENSNNNQSMENPTQETGFDHNNMGLAQIVEDLDNKQEDTVMTEAAQNQGKEIEKRRNKARRRSKRKGKGRDWNGTSAEDEKRGDCNQLDFGMVFKGGIGCEMKREGAAFFYSRDEMEGLRFIDKDRQLNKWVEVYCGLGPVVSKEYDALVAHQNEQDGVDFDPRKNLMEKVLLGGRHSHAVDPPDTASDLIGYDLDSCTGNEDDCSEDDDSDAEYNSIQRPAFVVTGEPNFDAGPAMDGFEYLRRVRWETERVQKVTFAKIEESKLCEQTVYIPKIPEIVQCPQHLLPLKEWEASLLNDFSELRLAISRYESSATNEVTGKMQLLPNILEEDCSAQILESANSYNPTDGTVSMHSSARDEKDASTIASLKISNSEDMANTPNLSTISCLIQSAAGDEDDASPKILSTDDIVNSPTLSTVLGIEPVARVSMLKKRIKLAEDVTSLSKNDCLWLFALSAAVDTPLNADTSAALRDLLRKCSSLRAEKSELDDEVVMLNILATIAGKYFGQSDD